jgi:HD-GYP domain-containing protein (c-di-GMP phosphodiesterase class II)
LENVDAQQDPAARREVLRAVFRTAFEEFTGRALGSEAASSDATVLKDAELCGRVDLAGPLNGYFLLAMDTATGRSLVSRVLGEPVDDDINAVHDGIGELVKKIAHSAVSDLQLPAGVSLRTPVYGRFEALSGGGGGEHLIFGTPWGRVLVGCDLRPPAARKMEITYEEADAELKLAATRAALQQANRALEARERVLEEEVKRLKEVTDERGRAMEELRKSQLDTLQRLAFAAELRDDVTGEHTQRVGEVSALIAQLMGLPSAQVELIRATAPLHDLGKIGIPDEILLKKGRFTKEEFDRMKRHTTIGSQILSGSRFLVLRIAEQVARSHHERWDGSGYPDGLKGGDIPLVARIVSVVDVFDALTHERPYKHAWTIEEAVDEIRGGGGKAFDPRIVDVFEGVYGGASVGS